MYSSGIRQDLSSYLRSRLSDSLWSLWWSVWILQSHHCLYFMDLLINQAWDCTRLSLVLILISDIPAKNLSNCIISPHSCSCFEKGCWKKVQKCTRQPPMVLIAGSFQVVFPWPQDFREICEMPQTVRANHSEFDEFTHLFDYLNSLITIHGDYLLR